LSKILFAEKDSRCNFLHVELIRPSKFKYMKEQKPSSGKISLHGNGMGVPSPDDIERRAREIALIDERDPNEFTDADWKQAREELSGIENDEPPEETPANSEMTAEWQVTPSDRGHRIPRPGVEEDEETVGEHLVSEGREEAERDQMIEARREELEQEGGIT
jgi:hypothetical protein